MRLFVIAVLLAMPGAVLAQPKDTAPPTLAITGVTVIDCTRAAAPPQPGMTVLVVGDRIAAVGKTSEVAIPEGAKQIRADGKFLIPGLWDMHVHLEDDFLPVFVANGVTGVRHMFSRPALVPIPVRQWQKDVEAGKLVGPQIVATTRVLDGLNGEGPVIPGSAIALKSPEEARAAVARLRKEGDDFIKIYPFLKPDVYRAILDEAAAGPRKLQVTGHVPHGVSVAEASELGQGCMEHCYGIVIACSKDEDKLRAGLVKRIEEGALAKDTLDATGAWRTQVKALDTYDEAKAELLFKKFAKNGTRQVPTLVTRRTFAYLNDPKFTDDQRKKSLPWRVRTAWTAAPVGGGVRYPVLGIELSNADIENQKLLFDGHLRLVKAMQMAGVPLLAGTDTPVPYCFPGSGLHDELELFVQAGLTPAEALATATRNPAEYLDRLKDLGTVERGKLADLVLLDADPLADIRNTRKIHAVVLGGRLFPKESLDKLADGRKP